MTYMNESTWDRLIRMLAGIALGYAAWMTWPASIMSRPRAVSILFLVIGAIAFVTGFMDWCARRTRSSMSRPRSESARESSSVIREPTLAAVRRRAKQLRAAIRTHDYRDTAITSERRRCEHGSRN